MSYNFDDEDEENATPAYQRRESFKQASFQLNQKKHIDQGAIDDKDQQAMISSLKQNMNIM